MSAVLNDQEELLLENSENLWQAIIARDKRFDGRFVFGVTSTGIYCRPSCPARRPRADRVQFFSTTAAAEQAGFRACRRCRPTQSSGTDRQVEMVQRACRLIEESSEERPSLDTLSDQLGLSPFHFQRTFKSIMGLTPRQYAEACRANRFRDGVRKGEKITAAMYSAGYGSSSRLYERAEAELGMTPATYGRGGPKTSIKYAITDSPLGQLLVAGTDKGICAVRLGDSAAALESDLSKEYAAARIEKDEKRFAAVLEQMLDYLAAKLPSLELPLDIRATAFQRQVWETLRAIPLGETRSYSEVAREIGKPTSVRAVARACATNPVALVIPCHRVIREDKSLGGYRWGLERKKKLLASEQEAVRRARE